MDKALLCALLTGGFVGAAAAYLGSLMITRRMALVGDALGHVALPGMGLALLLKLDPALGALLFLAVGVLLIWKLGRNTALSSETLVGVVFVCSLALGFLIVPEPELLESLAGDIAHAGPAQAAVSAALSAALILWVRRLYPGIMLANLSPDLAAVQGLSESRLNLAYLSAIGLVVAMGVGITGSLLVGALVIVPPAAARLLSRDLRRYGRLSGAFGAASGWAGVLLSHVTSFPPGPSIILMSGTLFLVSVLTRRVFAA